MSQQRVIDYVPLSIDESFLYASADALQDFLIEKLELGKPDATERCRAYLIEDPSIVANRDKLCTKQKRLEVVQRELFSFGLL